MDALPSIAFVLPNRFQVKKATFGCVALFVCNDTDADLFTFVAQHLNQPGVWNENEILVGACAEVGMLLPTIVFPDDERSNALANHPVNDPAAGEMQIGGNLAITLVCDDIQLAAGMSSGWKLRLEFRPPSIVPLVDGFERTPVNKKRLKAGLV